MELEGLLPRLHVPILKQIDQVHAPKPNSWISIYISSSHLRLGLPSGLFPSGFPFKTVYTPLISLIPATCRNYFILLDLITQTILGEQYRSLSYSLCSFLHSSVTSSLLCPNILLSTLFLNTLSLRSSLNVIDQVAHPYRTTGKVILLCNLIFIGLLVDSKLEDKRFFIEWWQAFSDFNKLLIFSWIKFWLLGLFPVIWTAPAFQRKYYQSLLCDLFVHSGIDTWPRT